MPSLYTIDASVFLTAFIPFEAGHQESHRLLAWLQAEAIPVIVPALLLLEVAAAIGRGRDDEALAREFAAALTRLWVPLDATLARQAAEVAAQHRLRGSDAIYAAVALRFGATFVTLDQQQRERVDRALSTRYPAEMLAEIKPEG